MPGDKITLSGVDVYLPPAASERATQWSDAIRVAPPEQLDRIVQLLLDAEAARIMRFVEESLEA